MSFICRLFRKKKKAVKDEIKLNLPIDWTQQDYDLVIAVNGYRFENNKSVLLFDDKMKRLSQGRVQWWEDHNTPDKELHFGFPLHAQIYLDKDYNKISENVQAGYTKFLRAYTKSDRHNESILKDDWKYIAATIKKFKDNRYRVCLILSK